jgi:sulfide:quinone oxidoreductase
VTGFRAVICGGGVAALEGLLRLRRLAGDAVDLTVVAPNVEFAYRPLAVLEAVADRTPRRYDLDRVVSHAGAERIRGTLASVDPDRRIVHTTAGTDLPFDALLVAVGSHQVADLDHVLTFFDAGAGRVHDRVIGDVIAGRARSVAFVRPDGPVHPLPPYELALLTAERARTAGIEDLELHLVTPEPSPLAVFGAGASPVVGGLLRQAGVRLHLSATAYVPVPGRLLVQPQGAELEPDAIVAMPRVTGPDIRGLPGGGPHGFLPIDRYCAVPGTDGRVFAAGDATAFPVKHGGLAAQQADTAAAAIAHLAGAVEEPPPFQGEIKGKLLTGGRSLYLTARVAGAQGFECEVSESPPWPVDEKIVAAELGPYLAGLDTA